MNNNNDDDKAGRREVVISAIYREKMAARRHFVGFPRPKSIGNAVKYR